MRVVLGILFTAHGISKVQMGLDNVAGWFGSLGIPGWFGYVVAIIELAGGILLMAGLFTRYVSVLLALVMVGAIVTVKFKAGLLGNGQMAGYELDLALLVMTVHFIFAGPARLSVDSLFLPKSSA
ncbi:DoxX family protein [Paenibacillus chartarius]|uniref:DoxX family protein n=1 Tax=Paenibacillus chartarius TaxID=747481 RepID=A0ABV6DFJ3_9BACL